MRFDFESQEIFKRHQCNMIALTWHFHGTFKKKSSRPRVSSKCWKAKIFFPSLPFHSERLRWSRYLTLWSQAWYGGPACISWPEILQVDLWTPSFTDCTMHFKGQRPASHLKLCCLLMKKTDYYSNRRTASLKKDPSIFNLPLTCHWSQLIYCGHRAEPCGTPLVIRSKWGQWTKCSI